MEKERSALLVSHEKIIENKHLGRRCYSTPFIGCAPLRDTPLFPLFPHPTASRFVARWEREPMVTVKGGRPNACFFTLVE